MSEASDAESFESAHDGQQSAQSNPPNHPPHLSSPREDKPEERLSPEEETSLLETSNTHKAHANSLFATSSHSEAIQIYDKALASLPSYFEYETAVLRCNIAACHLKLQEWERAVNSATSCLEGLERIDPTLRRKKEEGGQEEVSRRRREPYQQDHAENSGIVQEVDDKTAAKIEAMDKSGKSREEVQKIRVKALMRRAKAREALGGWAALQGASEDYQDLSNISSLSTVDGKTVKQAQGALPAKIEVAKQKEMGEMMGKLKDLGNGILKPFGLSTDNFQFNKDEKSGGYSMQFNQGNQGRGGGA